MDKVVGRETQADRIVAVLSDFRWHGLDDFGRDAYTARNRIGEERKRGLRIIGRRRSGERWWEYRCDRRYTRAMAERLAERLERMHGQPVAA
jgi:hypothetical protein